jgi:hypothetical protein
MRPELVVVNIPATPAEQVMGRGLPFQTFQDFTTRASSGAEKASL